MVNCTSYKVEFKVNSLLLKVKEVIIMKRMTENAQRKTNGGKGLLIALWDWIWGRAKKKKVNWEAFGL